MKKKIGCILIVVMCLNLLGCTSKNQQVPAKKIETSTVVKEEVRKTPPFEEWGLGKVISKQVSQNTNYEWFIDQMHTGYASDSNCGPSCTIMAAKWSFKNFPESVEIARDSAPNDGGWWYINNIYDFLAKNSIPTICEPNFTIEKALSQLDSGSILVVNINTGDITRNPNDEERTGKFYDENTGHFIVLKGYRIVDNKTYFEVYDPNNYNRYYDDGTEKGKDRYYLATEVAYSVNNWKNEYLIISKK